MAGHLLRGMPMLILFVIFVSAAGSAETIDAIHVEGLSSIDRDELLYLLDIKKGDALDRTKISNGIRRAFLKGIFENIAVSAEPPLEEPETATSAVKTRSGVKVSISVTERDIIKKVAIAGNEELSKKAVRRHLLFDEGQVMRYDLIERASRELRQALSEMGFPHAEVLIQNERTSVPYRVNLIVHLKEGGPELIRKIRIYGPQEEVLSLMRMNEGDIYDQFKLRKDLDAIKAYYREEGYISASVGPYTFFDGELGINVNPGTRLDISFEGNTVISTKDLKREMPFGDAGDFRNDLVEEAGARIVALYHTKGYPFAQLAPIAAKDADRTVLTFFVYEGEKVSVESVTFSGVSLNDQNLKEVLVLKEGEPYNPRLLSADRDIIEEFYHALGYIAVSVHEPKVTVEGGRARIHFLVTEGDQLMIETLHVRGTRVVTDAELFGIINVRKGSPYNEVDLSDARHRIIEFYREKGFNDVAVEIRREVQGREARVTFDIQEGLPTLLGKTVIVGNNNVKRRVIERELLYTDGSPYYYALLSRERQKLYKLGLFTDVTLEPLDADGTVRDVLITVNEGNAGAIEFGLGYGDYEKLRGFFAISYRNLFGMNRQASLRIEASTLELRYTITYLDPWFMNRPMPFKTTIIKEDREERNIDTGDIYYKLKRNAVSVGVEKKLGDHTKAELYYEYSRNDTSEVKPDMILTAEDAGTLKLGTLRPGIIYDSRDNPFEPRRGILAGLNTTLAASALLSETDFLKVSLNTFWYQELSKWFVLAAAFRFGAGWRLDSSEPLPLVERFFLGGRSTVRGYDQNTLGPKGSLGDPTGGDAFINANLELRTYLGKGIGIVTFLDTGNVWQDTSDIDLSLKYTMGLGLRYSTPVGPLRIDYGHKLNRGPGESPGKIHFTIGNAF